MVQYLFDEKNGFLIEDYDKAKTFASFLPGIAGTDGIPMWSFYVNRGQAMGSFGVKDKNGAIMEFFPANTMYRNVELYGFRTFVRINGEIHELFSSVSRDKVKRRMTIEQNILAIEEINETLKLRVCVRYFTMPHENFAAIARRVELESLDGGSLDLEVLDGMTQLLPYGVGNSAYQSTSNVLKSWFDVFNLDNRIPYYRVRASVGDSSEVSRISSGNFYLAFCSIKDGLIPPIVDMQLIFGENSACTWPDAWDCSLLELTKRNQVAKNKVSGGFAGIRVTNTNKAVLASIIGHISDVELLNNRQRSFTVDYLDVKEAEARELTAELCANVATTSGDKVFDSYVEQCYLDNLLRGGYPLVYDGADNKQVYHVYSRKHGDLEREYNFFSIEPSKYSQGNGSYRDVNQNRRNDIYFNPKVGDFNIRNFMDLIQIDGYNPLLVKGSSFKIGLEQAKELVKLVCSQMHKAPILGMLEHSFTPGMLAGYIADNKVKLEVEPHVFIEQVLNQSRQCFEAEFGEGYWSDHWTYNLDLIESYLNIYPDKLEQLLFQDKQYRFYDSRVLVLPRSRKYVLVKGKVRQYGAVLEDEEKCRRFETDIKETRWLRSENGTGAVYKTNLFVKLVSLALVKFTTLDPLGMGIEMEAEKPGWNDAMNGLPGLFGSGMGETFELSRLVDFILEASAGFDRTSMLPMEINELMLQVSNTLSLGLCDYEYWDAVSTLREEFREKVRFGINGKEAEVHTKEIFAIFTGFKAKLKQAEQKSLEYGAGIHPTYFTYEAAAFERMDGRNPVNGYDNVRVTRFEVKPVPRFLEGPARLMSGMRKPEMARNINHAIRQSNMYDSKLKMYRTSESLDNASYELGRVTAFTPGWLERESVFMHMEYKYLLAMLRAGLYPEFFEAVRTALPSFMRPEVYGRSTLENSSFIASSVNPDEAVHGRGFVARLTGAAAEMLSMWFMMMAGDQVFSVKEDRLVLSLKPILPGWLFDDKGQVGFRFLGHTEVTYFNRKKLDTFGEEGVKAVRIVLEARDGRSMEINDDKIAGEWAGAVRDGRVSRIQVYLD